MERCLHTGKELVTDEQVFYIEAEGGYVIGFEKVLYDYLTSRGWTQQEINESRVTDEDGEATVYLTTVE